MPRKTTSDTHTNLSPPVSRRAVLGAGAAAIASAAWAGAASEEKPQVTASKGRVKQSIVQWCFQDAWDVNKTAEVARQLGCVSVELVGAEHWDMLTKHGLVCAIAPSHGFVQGMNNPKYQGACLEKLRKGIDDCAAAGFPSIITFTGMRENIPDDVGMENCVKGYKEIVGYAEQKKVTLCLEMLNSRATGHMKGHPGYQGDHTDYCIDIIKKVSSPRLKLLFDIYHVQIMDGDIINRFRAVKEYVGHVHTAGNPGRGELDDKQEINYRPVIQAIADAGYEGYLGQEFMPTRDPLTGLQEAVTLCNV